MHWRGRWIALLLLAWAGVAPAQQAATELGWEYDPENARDILDTCAGCHGPGGWGEDDAPQLAGQYTEYLRRQITSFQSGERLNEDMEGVFESLVARDLEDVFAFLASLDD